MINIADWQILQQQRAELLSENTRLLHSLAGELGVDPEAIEGSPRPGAVRQDLMLNEVYDLTDMNTLLTSMIGKVQGDESTVTVLEDLPGVGAELAQNLRAAGLDTPQKVAQASDEELDAVPGVGPKKAQELKAAAG